MKKAVLSIIFAISSTLAYSQQEGVEIFAGGSTSILRGTIDEDVFEGDFSRRTSVYGGVLFLVPITDTFTVKPGIAYSGRGASADGETIKHNYTEIPFLFCLGTEKLNIFAVRRFHS